MLLIRFPDKNLGCNVQWDGATNNNYNIVWRIKWFHSTNMAILCTI
jgi:hypothetical protein